MGVDVARLLASADRDGRRVPARRRQPGLELGRQFGEGWRRAATRSASTDDRRRLRALGGAADRRVDRQAGEGARAGAGRVARRPRPAGARGRRSPTRTRSGGVLPLGVRGRRRRRRCSGSTRSTSPTSRLRRTRRTRCSPPARRPSSSREGSIEELLAQAQRARLRLHPGVHRPERARTTRRDRRPRRARAQRAASSPTATGRATCTRRGSCTRAARTPGSSSRSSTTPATRSRFPASRSAFAA